MVVHFLLDHATSLIKSHDEIKINRMEVSEENVRLSLYFAIWLGSISIVFQSGHRCLHISFLRRGSRKGFLLIIACYYYFALLALDNICLLPS